jgi:sigma-B regulation protein RsbU (phosphoserine phosphatase)
MSSIALRPQSSPPAALFPQRKVDALLSLQKAAQQIASILDLNDLLDTIVHRIAVDFGCIESSILLVEGEQFHLAAVHGCTQSCKGERFPITEGLSGQVLASGHHYYAPDVRQELLYRSCEPHTLSEVVLPLKAGERVIGVFSASHHEPDAFPRAQIELLKALCGQMAVAIDNVQRHARQRQQIERLSQEQDEARRIQQGLLPRSVPEIPGFALEAESVSAGAVGGDWYDYFPLSDGRVGIVLADVSGKGMPAALLMSAVRATMRMVATYLDKEKLGGPGQVLGKLNRMLLNDFPSGQYVTMIYAVLDPARRTLTFSSAGHPAPLLCHGNDVRPLHSDSGTPLGLLAGDFSEQTVTLCHDFHLLFYTDGISEAVNHADEEFGSARVMDLVRKHHCVTECLMQAVKEFQGASPQRDDATVVVLRSAN